jgi:hypothetical protein
MSIFKILIDSEVNLHTFEIEISITYYLFFFKY